MLYLLLSFLVFFGTMRPTLASPGAHDFIAGLSECQQSLHRLRLMGEAQQKGMSFETHWMDGHTTLMLHRVYLYQDSFELSRWLKGWVRWMSLKQVGFHFEGLEAPSYGRVLSWGGDDVSSSQGEMVLEGIRLTLWGSPIAIFSIPGGMEVDPDLFHVSAR